MESNRQVFQGEMLAVSATVTVNVEQVLQNRRRTTMGKTLRKVSRPEEEVHLGNGFRSRAYVTSKGNPSCDSWHPPVCQNYKSLTDRQTDAWVAMWSKVSRENRELAWLPLRLMVSDRPEGHEEGRWRLAAEQQTQRSQPQRIVVYVRKLHCVHEMPSDTDHLLKKKKDHVDRNLLGFSAVTGNFLTQVTNKLQVWREVFAPAHGDGQTAEDSKEGWKKGSVAPVRSVKQLRCAIQDAEPPKV